MVTLGFYLLGDGAAEPLGHVTLCSRTLVDLYETVLTVLRCAHAEVLPAQVNLYNMENIVLLNESCPTNPRIPHFTTFFA